MSAANQAVPTGDYPLPIGHRIGRCDVETKKRKTQKSLRPSAALAVGFVLFLVVAALTPSWLAPADPMETNSRQAFQPPGQHNLLGTDENGRDVYTRIVYGVRPSLLMGLGATGIGVLVGTALGLAAGLGHSTVDGLLMRFVDVLLAFPDLLFALVIITIWGQGMFITVVALGFASVPRYARMARAQAQVVRRSQYIESSAALGMSRTALVLRHIIPNATKPIVLLAVIGIGGKIAAAASISFLGFGPPPPAAEWGSMLSTGRSFLGNAWWLTAAPSVAIILTVLSMTVLGREAIRRSEGRRT